MPVFDTPVHPSTVGKDRYEDCQNSVRKSSYWMKEVTYDSGLPVEMWVKVPDRASKECRYDKSLSDSKCEGCAHRGDGELYWGEYRSKIEAQTQGTKP